MGVGKTCVYGVWGVGLGLAAAHVSGGAVGGHATRGVLVGPLVLVTRAPLQCWVRPHGWLPPASTPRALPGTPSSLARRPLSLRGRPPTPAPLVLWGGEGQGCFGRGGVPPLQGGGPMPSLCPATVPLTPSASFNGMAFVTDSNCPHPLWQPPPTACPKAAGAASEARGMGPPNDTRALCWG